MRLRLELKRLKEKFQRESAKKEGYDVVSIFKETLIFIDSMKEALKNASPEEKKDILQVMAELHALMQEESKKIAEKIGVSEDQMVRIAENPDNFSPGQWKALESIKGRIKDTTVEMKQLLRNGDKKEIKEGSNTARRPKSSKKDRWLRS